MRILITGASGSGTSTLGRALATSLDAAFIDTDDYFWLPTEPPFKQNREPRERRALLHADLERAPSCAVAGSVMQWGSAIENAFALIVFLTLDADIRVERLRAREIARLGKVDEEFLAWAAQYEEGHRSGRSRARHEKWLSERSCPVLRLDGDLTVAERLRRVLHETRP